MTVGFVFPGQGSQSIGMLEPLAQQFSVVRETFDEASDALGYDLWALCQEGPERHLNQTEQTQPAMLTAGVAVWRVWLQSGGAQPSIAAGHSLGEYSALVAASSLAFDDAAKLVQLRGRLMQAAVPQGEGAIAAVLGLDDAAIAAACDEVCSELPEKLVVPVNFNAPGQVVIAGHAVSVQRALEVAKEAGAKKCVPLPMSVPVHCELMRPAAQGLGEALAEADLRAPSFKVVQNADLEVHPNPEAIRKALIDQLYTPVRWGATMTQIGAAGVDVVIECGPGRVLAGLAKRIDRSLNCMPVFDPASLEKALEAASA